MISFDFNEVAGFLINVGAVLALVFAVYRGLRKWVQKAATEASDAARVVQRQLKTSNGRTIAEYVESSAHQIDDLVGELSATKELINTTALRLDQHIQHHDDRVRRQAGD